MEKITLYRGMKCYFALNQDAEVVSNLCGVNFIAVGDMKYSVFLTADLDKNLQTLIKNGYCIEIRNDVEK